MIDFPAGDYPMAGESLRCPHCLVTIHVIWNTAHVLDDASGSWTVRSTTCPAPGCGRATIRLIQSFDLVLGNIALPTPPRVDRMVWPKSIARAPLPPQVPPEVAEDYVEACNVLTESLKASAALSRRCLQTLLVKTARVKKKDLFDQIQEVLDAKTLPGPLAEDLHAVRLIGNFGAHPIKSKSTGQIVPVETGEPEWNLDVLEALFDFYYVEPERHQKRRDALNTKLKDAGKEPLP
jgi:hypothetical protein